MEIIKNNKAAKKLLSKMDNYIYSRLLKCNGYIAGGAVLSAYTYTKINDYDIYFFNDSDADEFVKSLNATNKVITWNDKSLRDDIIKESNVLPVLINRSINAETYLFKGMIYQVIKAFYMSPEKIFEKFDFTVCMGAYVMKEKGFVLHKDFSSDIISKTLRFNIGTEYPIASLMRIFKYQKKGYNFSGIEAIKLALTIHHLDLKDYKELSRQLMGIDTLFLADLTATLNSDEFSKKEYEYNDFLHQLDEYIDYIDNKVFDDMFNDNEDPL